ncbi:hypothetical protein Patl1_27855 [Pistacia atlantica]|uniref:Uncharacterized protein n=1 Tax=Pistacia atlantica TaxID=434234 RepID=A0ACC1BFC8_9ROSI|nr:hypothetical protein Patl1_27855 [Pistacia atlantica]
MCLCITYKHPMLQCSMQMHTAQKKIPMTGEEDKPEEGSKGYKEWMRKNAMALHAIQISCGADIMSKYRGNESAKKEWDILTKKVRRPQIDGEDKQETLSLLEYRTLYKAVAKGDWDSTKDFLDKNPAAIRAKITLNGSTVFHVAVIAGQPAILEKLLEMSTIEDLELQNDMGYTAFVIAAINGFKDMVEAMFIRDENLINIKEKHGLIPIVAASVACSTKVVRYLYPKTPDEMLSPEHPDRSGATLLNSLIVDDIYGIRVTPTLYGDEYSISNDEESGIRILLEPNIQQVVLKKLRGLVWKLLTWIFPDISNIYKRKSNHIEAKKFLKSIINHIPRLSMEQLQKFGWDQAISEAIKNGISEFVDEVIESTPELIWKKDENG